MEMKVYVAGIRVGILMKKRGLPLRRGRVNAQINTYVYNGKENGPNLHLPFAARFKYV